ncbi:MAG: hypothetical protein LBC94_01345 [Desulfovibrio sp.]|nr:hypothetical protein [Desulfovibrio sp.]
MAFFQKTRLLAHPGETAAQILIRAHKREPDAVFLVVLGYIWGAHGFPRDIFLAIAWLEQLRALEYTPVVHLLTVLMGASLDLDVPTALGSGVHLADCGLAREASHADMLKNAGLFDLDAICAQTEKAASKFSEVHKKNYAERLAEVAKHKNEIQSVISLMRELRSRPATLDEQEKIVRFTREYSVDTALFFAATNHSPGKGQPDWSAEKLLAFFIAQREDLTRKHQAEVDKPEMLREFFNLTREAGEVFRRRLTNATGNAEALITNAHLGDIPSIRAVAAHYANGTADFIKFRQLSNYWLQHAAMRADGEAAFAWAVAAFDIDQLTAAWTWASIFLEYYPDNADAATRTNAQTLINRIEAVQGEKKSAEREKAKDFMLGERARLMDWRRRNQEKQISTSKTE